MSLQNSGNGDADTKMEIGIFCPDPTVKGLVDRVIKAHSDGFGHVMIPQLFGYDALTALAVVASHVPDIDVGVGIVPTYRQHPMMLAQQALTVNQVAAGRLTLGIGVSHQIVVEGLWGLSYERPLRHMREFIDAAMPLLEGQPAAAEGETIVARGALEIDAPRPVVVLAALGPKMLDLAGRRADGTTTWMVGPKTLANHIVPTINESANDAGRPSPHVIVSLPVCVTADRGDAMARAAQEFTIYGQLPAYRAMLDREGVRGPEDVAVIGSADEVAERLSQFADGGTTRFMANEIGTPNEQAATRELLIALR